MRRAAFNASANTKLENSQYLNTPVYSISGSASVEFACHNVSPKVGIPNPPPTLQANDATHMVTPNAQPETSGVDSREFTHILSRSITRAPPAIGLRVHFLAFAFPRRAARPLTLRGPSAAQRQHSDGWMACWRRPGGSRVEWNGCEWKQRDPRGEWRMCVCRGGTHSAPNTRQPPASHLLRRGSMRAARAGRRQHVAQRRRSTASGVEQLSTARQRRAPTPGVGRDAAALLVLNSACGCPPSFNGRFPPPSFVPFHVSFIVFDGFIKPSVVAAKS